MAEILDPPVPASSVCAAHTAETITPHGRRNDISCVLRSEPVVETVRLPVGIAEPFGFPEFHGRILSEDYDVHAAYPLSAEDVPCASDESVRHAFAAPFGTDDQMVHSRRASVAPYHDESHKDIVRYSLEAIAHVPFDEKFGICAGIGRSDRGPVLLPQRRHLIVIIGRKRTVGDLCHGSRDMISIDNRIPPADRFCP